MLKKIMDVLLFPIYLIVAVFLAILYSLGDLVFNVYNMIFLYWKAEEIEAIEWGNGLNKNNKIIHRGR